jgi:hypothetical protein
MAFFDIEAKWPSSMAGGPKFRGKDPRLPKKHTVGLVQTVDETSSLPCGSGGKFQGNFFAY